MSGLATSPRLRLALRAIVLTTTLATSGCAGIEFDFADFNEDEYGYAGGHYDGGEYDAGGHYRRPAAATHAAPGGEETTAAEFWRRNP